MSERGVLRLGWPGPVGSCRCGAVAGYTLELGMWCGQASHYRTFPLEVAILVGEEHRATVSFDQSGQERWIQVPLEGWCGCALTVQLHSASTFVPLEAGLSEDARHLSIALQQVGLRTRCPDRSAAPPSPGTTVQMAPAPHPARPARRLAAAGEPLRFELEYCTANGIRGWAVHPSGVREVRVLVDGRRVGAATLGIVRPDVQSLLADAEGARTAGFAFAFSPEQAWPRPLCDVTLELEPHVGPTTRVTATGVATIRPGPEALAFRPEVDAVFNAPLPHGVASVLHALKPEAYPAHGRWGQEQVEAAMRDLADLVDARANLAPITRYVLYLRSLAAKFQLIQQQFPLLNPRSQMTDKDHVSVTTSPREMLSIAHHLYVLKSYGLQGHFLEFGCFKGFSTACLSHACHELGIPMDVFDSFAGLPDSDSTVYRAGEFFGGLEEVSGNVQTFGQPAVVTYHPGFFDRTAPGFSHPVLALWMDVDLHRSAQDVLASMADKLPLASALFSHECSAACFAGGVVQPEVSEVLPPIIDAFARRKLAVEGVHLHEHTGAFWSARHGLPALPYAMLGKLLPPHLRP